MASVRDQLKKKQKMQPRPDFKSALPPWATKVPKNDPLLVARFCGVEKSPSKPGWVKDKVLNAEGNLMGMHLLLVPETYWVPLGMVDWTITVQQHLLKRLPQLPDNIPRQTTSKMKAHLSQYIYWLIRCRAAIAQEARALPDKGGELRTCHELMLRLYMDLTKAVSKKADRDMFAKAQRLSLTTLFDHDLGFIGESSELI